MEDQTLKLDIYNSSVCNNLYNCEKGEGYCKTMVSKLIFYDRDELLQMHSDSLTDREIKYDVSRLTPKPFLGKNEKVDRVVPLESHWIAVLFSDKVSKKIIQNKVIYISSEGDGYFSDDMESALNGVVPEELYCKYIGDYPNSLLMLDKKYYDGTHDDFLKKLNDIAREKFTKLFADVLDNPNIKLEDLSPMITEGFRKRKNDEEFEKIKLIDFLYSQFPIDEIIEFDKKYNERNSYNQPS